MSSEEFQKQEERKYQLEQHLKIQLNHVSSANTALTRLRANTTSLTESCAHTKTEPLIIRENILKIKNAIDELETCSKQLTFTQLDSRGKYIKPLTEDLVTLSDGKTQLPIINGHGGHTHRNETVLNKYLKIIENEFPISYYKDLKNDTNKNTEKLFYEAFSAYNWNKRLVENMSLANSVILQQQISYHKPRWSTSIPKEEINLFDKTLFHNNKLLNEYSNYTPYEILMKLFIEPLKNSQNSQNLGYTLSFYAINKFTNVESNNNRILEVNVFLTFKAFIVLRGFTIESIIVKGWNEDESRHSDKEFSSNYDMFDHTEDSGPGDFNNFNINSTSKYKVFQKITDIATIALQHYKMHNNYYSITRKPNLSTFDQIMKSIIHWLKSYRGLFKQKCDFCDKLFDDDYMVPVWRDFKNFQPCHSGCVRRM